MSLRNALRELPRWSSTTSGTSSSASSSTTPSRSNSVSSVPLRGPNNDLLYHQCMTTSPPMHLEPEPLRPQRRSNPLEELLDAAGTPHCSDKTENDDADTDAPPPYMLLCNGDKKPEYSSNDPLTMLQQPPSPSDPSRLDGVLCIRCNIRKAKAWYLRTQQDRGRAESRLPSDLGPR